LTGFPIPIKERLLKITSDRSAVYWITKEDLIEFLGGYNMFGLLFNGLLQPFDSRRKRQSPDGFIEMMTPVKRVIKWF
jgi:hypothetical protein